MSEVEQVVENLRKQQADQGILVAARDDAQALAKNPAFQRLILNGFCLTEAARYVQESCDPMLAPHMRADALNMAQASGHLKRFLSLTITIGNTAEDNVLYAEQQIEDVLVNGLNPVGDE